MLTMFVEDQLAIVKLQLFGHEPFTPKVSLHAFEHLLNQTHDALRHNLGQGMIEERLLPYSGPQCHEDRDKQHLMNYNPDFRRKAPIVQTEAVPTNGNANSNRPQPQPIPSQPLPTNHAGHASQPTTADQSADIHTIFSNCSLRVCKRCKRTRVLDERATTKFPLSTYEYGRRTVLVEFTCDKLVSTTCGTEEDITRFTFNNDTPTYLEDCLIVDKSRNPRIPTCSIWAIINETSVTNMPNDNVHEIKIVGNAASYKAGINCYKDHEFNTIPERMLGQYKPGGKIVLGREGRRGFTPIIKNLRTYKFTVPQPREAKCCQPSFDKVQDLNDRFEAIGIERITTIRNLHAVVNALKILRCLKCGRQTPGLNIKYSQLTVLQQGHKKVLNDGHIVMALNNSQVLQKGVQLSPTFSDSPECINASKFAAGVCTDCAPYYSLDAYGSIKPNHDYKEFLSNIRSNRDQPQQPSDDRVENQNFNFRGMNPYSDQNLVSTFIWIDNSYCVFVKTLT